VRSYLVGHDGIVVDGLAGAEHVGLVAVLDLDLPLHAVEPLLPLMGIQLVRCLAGGAHGDDERVHMTGGTARRQAEVGQVAGVLSGLERFHALHFLHLIGADVGGPVGLVVIHEGAQAHAEGAGKLDQRRQGRRHLAGLQLLDDRHVATATVGQILAGQMMRLAQRGDLAPELVVLSHNVPP